MLPFCQPSGEFHGREDKLSGSALSVAQPAQTSPVAPSARKSLSQWILMNRSNLILFLNQ